MKNLFQTKGLLLFVLGMICLLFSRTAYLVTHENAEDILKKNDDSDGKKSFQFKTTTTQGNSNNVCAGICKNQRDVRIDKFGGDLLDRTALVKIVQEHKERLLEKLHVDYGKDNFENIFADQNNDSNQSDERYRGKIAPKGESGHSSESLKRKLMIKLLSVQIAIAKREVETSGCACLLDGESTPVGEVVDTPWALKDTYEHYVWATTGYSIPAGHGNLFNESFTAYMNRDLKPIFGSLGIEFDGRNYGMGGTSPGYELSGCFEQIFGNDVDFFSVDFGTPVTDGKMLHFLYKGIKSPGHPAVIHQNTKTSAVGFFQHLENNGVAVFISPESTEKEIRDAIPDSTGRNSTELQEMPEYVRNLKCDGMLEKGDPYCQAEKYSTKICPDRKLRTSWHPGFKVHAIEGHTLALFLLQHLMDAVVSLSQHEIADPEILLVQLKEEDGNLFKRFENTAPILDDIKFAKKTKSRSNWDNEHTEVIDLMMKGQSICRTGRLPAEARYLGYMASSGKVGGIAPLGNETYDTGIELHRALHSSTESNAEMRLVYENEGRFRDYNCLDVQMKPDYKDFFLVHSPEGWVKFTFPNEAEKKAYRHETSKFKGLLVMEEHPCKSRESVWNTCGSFQILLREDPIKSGDLEITVNGNAVTSIGLDGIGLLEGEHGLYWEANADGVYEILFRVNKPGFFFRMSAMVLYW